MITLGIETSCDETALCLLETQGEGETFQYRILENIVHSQIDTHREYGGVFPMLAKREHIKNLPIIFQKLLEESQVNETHIHSIAVTQGPGLEPALWTGIAYAEELGKKLNIPVIPVNHMEGHIVSTLLSDSKPSKNFNPLKPFLFPSIALLISGGHTELIEIEKFGAYKVLGRTRDDAVGEAFDKVARMLELPYPGGPEISKLADQARSEKLEKTFSLPRPMITSKDLDFSFSGLKTAVLYYLKEKGTLTLENKKEIACEFEDAVTEVLISKTASAIEDHECRTIIVAGGVSANSHIRSAFESLADTHGIPLYMPSTGLSGDNALMIALVASLQSSSNIAPKAKGPLSIKAQGNLSLES